MKQSVKEKSWGVWESTLFVPIYIDLRIGIKTNEKMSEDACQLATPCSTVSHIPFADEGASHQLLCLHFIQDGPGELVSSSLTTHVACSCLALGDNIINCLGDSVRMVVKTKMSQHHASGKNESSWVGLILALDIKTNVTASRLENGDVTTHVAAWYDARAADKTGTNVGEDTTVQVGHDHDVELLRLGYTLHGGVVDNHVVCLNGRVFLADLADRVAEETISQFHDVGLVDASDLAAVVGKREGECELGDTL